MIRPTRRKKRKASSGSNSDTFAKARDEMQQFRREGQLPDQVTQGDTN